MGEECEGEVRNKDHLYREVVSEWKVWIDGVVA